MAGRGTEQILQDLSCDYSKIYTLTRTSARKGNEMSRKERLCPLLLIRGWEYSAGFCKRDLCEWWIAAPGETARWPEIGEGCCVLRKLAEHPILASPDSRKEERK